MSIVQMLVFYLLLLLPTSGFAVISATVDRTSIAADDKLILTINKQGTSNGSVDLSPLQKDFVISEESTSSSIRSVNGKTTFEQTLSIVLTAKNQGQLTIPALVWGGERTQPIDISVVKSSKKPKGSATEQVLFDIEWDRTTPFYFGSSRLLTLNILTKKPFYDAKLIFEGNSGIQLRIIGKVEEGQTTKRGQHYYTYQMQYILTPRKSGKITFSGPELSATIASDDNMRMNLRSNHALLNRFFTRQKFRLNYLKSITISAPPITLNIKAQPDNRLAGVLLPAQQLTATSVWKDGTTTAEVGEPMTLHLYMQAQELTGAQLPNLAEKLTLPKGLKAYPNPASTTTTIKHGKLIATSEQTIAIIGQISGHYKPPELVIPWWDSTAGMMKKTVLDLGSIDITSSSSTPPAAPVKPASSTPFTPGDASAKTGDDEPSPVPEQWLIVQQYRHIALIGIAIVIVMALLWLWRHVKKTTGRIPLNQLTNEKNADTRPKVSAQHRRKPFPDRRKAVYEIRKAIHLGDAKATKKAILAWAETCWPEHPPRGLLALADKTPAKLKQLLVELDSACYNDTPWQPEVLLAAIEHFKIGKTTIGKTTKTSSQLITRLYH